MAFQLVYKSCKRSEIDYFTQLGDRLFIRNEIDLADSGIPIIFNDDYVEPYQIVVRVNDNLQFYRNDIEIFGTLIFTRDEELYSRTFCTQHPDQIIVWDSDHTFGYTLTYPLVDAGLGRQPLVTNAGLGAGLGRQPLVTNAGLGRQPLVNNIENYTFENIIINRNVIINRDIVEINNINNYYEEKN